MSQHTLLFVDDEEKVLKSLTRAFLNDGFRILTATSGREGVEKIQKEKVSLVISDQRMLEMKGDEFLKQVKEISPDTIRIMLTGYADLESIVAAINKGEIYRYISKPWKTEDLKITVRGALREYDLIAENKELHQLAKEQNAALNDINKNLEQKVSERTQELEDNFITSIRVFTGLISKYDDSLGKHSKRVSVLARKLAQRMNLPNRQVLDIEIAGLLHDIGAIGMPKRIFTRYARELSKNEVAQLKSHPVVGQETLMVIGRLKNVGSIIRHHHECYDGSGYPDGLREEQVPLEARILAVVDTFDLEAYIISHAHKSSPQLAREYLRKRKGGRFDPEIVDAFLKLLEEIKDAKN